RPATRIGGGDLPVVRIDPKNPDVVYSASVVTWKSTDGGKTWTGIRGAPGGDDYQNVWINPNNTDIILLGSDQGAIITVNGGKTWSSWYNQPTAQLYHVGADNAFPYRVCSGQQESGSACISSRGDDGEITFREWHPVAAEEYGYVTPDPLDPDIVFGGKLTRYDRRTGQAQPMVSSTSQQTAARIGATSRPHKSARGRKSPSSKPATLTRRRLTLPSIPFALTTCARTSIARAMEGSRGQRLRTASRQARPSTSCART